ncbi:hypothetical protein Sjap_009234 [Stephania japonica]|uniref:Uncharacterized protein n=1 Tax=Stephania japonica TaxID=461633 RepID=A0AAP0PFC6_9MAGN
MSIHWGPFLQTSFKRPGKGEIISSRFGGYPNISKKIKFMPQHGIKFQSMISPSLRGDALS